MTSSDERLSIERAHLERVHALFTTLYPLSAAERQSRLAAEGADRETVEEVRDLLLRSQQADEESGDDLEDSVSVAAANVLHDPAHMLPERLGEFVIQRVVARGGMGLVCEALQDNPERRVALKLIRPDVATKTALRRFESEAQVLGRLSHDAIARVYSVGAAATTMGEQPYIAMEYVDGRPLDEACQGAPLRDRIELLIRICEAVHHAHQRGVIHRDLKPANVLVTHEGTPKVLDFGIARLEESRSDRATTAGKVLGTLAYASPEQLLGDPGAVDVRSDVYALGVLLYEVLSDKLPVDVEGRPFPEVVRRALEQEPVRLGQLDRALRGDLETIAAVALAKEPDARYASAQALADDLRRYLDDQPIVARPPGTLYILRKLARRHRPMVLGAGVGLLALIVGLIVSLRAASDAREARDHADAASVRSSLATASAQIQLSDVRRARASLLAVPEHRRAWPWHLLQARLDDSMVSVSRDLLPASDRALPATFAVPLEDGGVRMVTSSDGHWQVGDVHNGGWRTVRTFTDATAVLPSRTTRYACVYRAGGPHVVELATGAIKWRAPALDGFRGAWISRHDDYVTVREREVDRVYALDGGGPVLSLSIPGGIDDLAGTGEEPIALGIVGLEKVAAYGADGRLLWEDDCDVDRPRFLTADSTGSRVLVLGYGGSWSIVDARTGEVVTRPQRPGVTVHAADFVEGRPEILTVDERGRLQLWDARTGRPLDALLGQNGCMLRFRVRTTATRAATVGLDGVTYLWDIGPLRARRTRLVHTSWATGLTVSGDRRLGLSTGYDGRLVAVDLGTLTPVATLMAGQERCWYAAWVDERHVALLAGRREAYFVAVLDAWTGRVLARRPVQGGPEPDACYDPVRRVLYAGGGGTELIGFSVPTLDIVRRVPWGSAAVVASSDDGARLVFGAAPAVLDLDRDETRSGSQTQRFMGYAFSPLGDRVAGAALDGTLHVWDSRTLRRVAVRSGHAGRALCVAWHPDGRYLVTGGDDGILMVWDGRTFEHVVDLPAHDAYVRTIAFREDGAVMYTSCGDGTVGRWSAESTRARSSAGPALVAAREQARQWLAGRTGPPEVLWQASRDDPTLDAMARHGIEIELLHDVEQR